MASHVMLAIDVVLGADHVRFARFLRYAQFAVSVRRARARFFCLVARLAQGSCRIQQPIAGAFDDDHLFIDLVFYNILLKCYLLIVRASKSSSASSNATGESPRRAWGRRAPAHL